MKYYYNFYSETLDDYIKFLKKKKIYKKNKIFFYENSVEKLCNWTNIEFKKSLNWFQNIKKKNKAIIKNIHLEKMNRWEYNPKKGVINHKSKEFFVVEGKRITNANREVHSWDQPFLTQVGYKGGIIGLVRTNINGIPHYLIDAKFEPGNYGKIQLSPSLQATYSNLDQIHEGEKNLIVQKFFKKKFKTIRKFWVTEDGGRLYLKRNLHWIIQYYGIKIVPRKTYKWMTLWEIQEFINKGSLVGPHLRSILSLI
jgi:dTDP-4-dehydro-6-deoxy-alpha-D-glucopyranose 2,3-dehydratase